MTTQFNYPLPFGSELQSDGTARFRLWAPGAANVALEIEGQTPVPMQSEEGGWVSARTKCAAGARYRYRVKDDLAVPDPASRRQGGDVHDASVVVDPRDYSWKDRKSTRLNSSHVRISYAVFCLKKKNTKSIRFSIVKYCHATLCSSARVAPLTCSRYLPEQFKPFAASHDTPKSCVSRYLFLPIA